MHNDCFLFFSVFRVVKVADLTGVADATSPKRSKDQSQADAFPAFACNKGVNILKNHQEEHISFPSTWRIRLLWLDELGYMACSRGHMTLAYRGQAGGAIDGFGLETCQRETRDWRGALNFTLFEFGSQRDDYERHCPIFALTHATHATKVEVT